VSDRLELRGTTRRPALLGAIFLAILVIGIWMLTDNAGLGWLVVVIGAVGFGVLRGSGAARELLEAAFATDRPTCSVLTRFELLAGMRSGERHWVRLLIDSLEPLDLSEQIANRAGEWARTYRNSHADIGAIDYLIAATADFHDADLLTRTVRHFPMFPDLQPVL
jgi:predicted nucleic acid-binding protein